MIMTDWWYCTAETNETSKSNFPPIKKKEKEKVYDVKSFVTFPNELFGQNNMSPQ